MKQVISNKGNLDEPPSNIRSTIADRILHLPHNRGITGRREVALLQHLSSPMPCSRLRNDSILLASL